MSSDPLRAVADELEIRNLIARLAHSADDAEDLVGDYVSLFTEDAIWEGASVGHRQGHAVLLAGAKERRESGGTGPGSCTRHVINTCVIEVDGDEATGRSIFHFYTGTDGAPVLAIIGVYHDRFRRTAEGWRLAHRVIHRANDPDTNTP
jgi:hypothetical protein